MPSIPGRIRPEQAFYLQNGEHLTSPHQLFGALEGMDPALYAHHTDGRNDFSRWLADVFHLHRLAQAIRDAPSPAAMLEAWKAFEQGQKRQEGLQKYLQRIKTLLPIAAAIVGVLLFFLIFQQIHAQQVQLTALRGDIQDFRVSQQVLQDTWTRALQVQANQSINILVPNISLFDTPSANKAAPFPRISKEQISIKEDRIELRIPNISWASFAGSGSMLPTLDDGAYGLQVVPENSSSIHVGDVISFVQGEEIIIHRVQETGADQEGWFAITQGDNNPQPDPEKVRFSQVTGILVGIIY